jgi:hypothetical protein
MRRKIMTDKQHQPDDRYARQSFSFRGMKAWQVWGVTAVSAAIVVALLVYSTTWLA